jgi:hypothetical protein
MPSSTPPTSSLTSRDATCYLERSHYITSSPENCRLPTDPSINLLRVQPTDLSTRLSSIPPSQHDGPQVSTSALTLAPPFTTSMADSTPSHRETLSSTQLRATFAALSPLNHPRSCQPILTSAQLAARSATLPPLIPPSRFIEHNVCI